MTGILHTASGARAVVTVRCPECGKIHRHDLGQLDDPEVREMLQRRWVDQWMVCRADLPGNFYRIVFRSSQVRATLPAKPPVQPEVAQGVTAPATAAPRRRRRRKRKRGAGPAAATPATPTP